MSTETQEAMEMGTKPVEQHKWLHKLVGEWRTETEMTMGPDKPKMTASGKESVKMLGELWAIGEGISTGPDGDSMEMRHGIGYDVSFKEYRAFFVMSMSSHLWKSVGTLSENGMKMTLNCTGPHMEKDGETAEYRDVIEFIDDNHRTLTSYGQQENGEWQEFMKAHYYRI